MKQKIFYYHFKKINICLVAAILEIALICYVDVNSFLMWSIFVMTMAVWGYKNLIKHPAVIITDKDIKIDYSRPIAWTDIKYATIKNVQLLSETKRVLALIPKENIHYHYSYLQKNNCDFGPFPIPLYGVLTAEDEKEIIRLIEQKIEIK